MSFLLGLGRMLKMLGLETKGFMASMSGRSCAPGASGGSSPFWLFGIPESMSPNSRFLHTFEACGFPCRSWGNERWHNSHSFGFCPASHGNCVIDVFHCLQFGAKHFPVGCIQFSPNRTPQPKSKRSRLVGACPSHKNTAGADIRQLNSWRRC